jgi:hypothetical protein
MVSKSEVFLAASKTAAKPTGLDRTGPRFAVQAAIGVKADSARTSHWVAIEPKRTLTCCVAGMGAETPELWPLRKGQAASLAGKPESREYSRQLGFICGIPV